MDLKIHSTGVKFENFNLTDESGNYNISQQELDQMFDEWQQSLDQQKCDHNWTEYNGFTQKYHFCTICDEKR